MSVAKKIRDKSESQLLVVGLIRNCSKDIKHDVLRLRSAIGQVDKLFWLLIESDSEDDSVEQLHQLATEIDNFNFISLGQLRREIHARTARIAHCRNFYVKEIRENNLYKDIDYIVVSDFDGINNQVNGASINSCWTQDNWDMCAANQLGPYYDIWALRHKDWSPNDCWSQFNFFNKYDLDIERNLNRSVYSRMIRIPPQSKWIEVDSAFGGLAIYKKQLFDWADYVGLDNEGNEICEHVSFHKKLKDHGAKLYINPALINASYTEHTNYLKWHVSLIRNLEKIPNRLFKLLKNLVTFL